MFECKNVAGRVVRSIQLFGGGSDAPEVSLVTKHALEGKLTQDEGGEPVLLERYDIAVPIS